MTKLSLASQRVIDRVPPSAQSAVKRRMQKLERELAMHRAASIALVEANEKGGVNDSHTDWNDIDAARELAEEALGQKEVKRIRKEVREAYGVEEEGDEDAE